ncbi:hypothetical protein [Actinoallomurus sp. NPDC052274]|uniref:hypothetical protein n=1 Tax=Actinoallomurus sp. NPDC052274 TaxID=3155420 RepID=UPI003417819F
MKIKELHGVLAAGTGEDGAKNFLDNSAIGTVVITICGVAGVIILIVCIFRMVKSVTNGRPGEGFKIFFWGLVVGGLLFRLDVTIAAVSWMSSLLEKVFQSTKQVTG